MAWQPLRRNGTALYDFAPGGEFQVPLVCGAKVEVFEESSGWYKGTVHTDPPKKGIFPASFVKLSEEIPDDPPPLPPQSDESAMARLEAIRQEKARLQEQARQAELEDQARAPGKIKVFRQGSANAGTKRFNGKGFNADAPSAAQAVADGAGAKPAASSGRPPPPAGSAKPPPPRGPVGSRAPPPSVQTLAAGAPATSGSAANQRPTTAPVKPRTATLMPEEDEQQHHISHDISVEALFDEIAHCMVDWQKAMHGHLRGGQNTEYHRTMERMSSLLELRNKVMTERKPEVRERIRDQIIQLIESSRKAQEGYTVPRNIHGNKADASNTGIIDLLELHREMYNKVQQETDTPFQRQGNRRRQSSIAATRAVTASPSSKTAFPAGPVQLLLDVKMCIFSAGENTEIYLGLWSQSERRFITENFVDVLTDQGLPEKRELIGNVRTMFQDLDANDFGKDLYIVAYVYRVGRLVYEPKKKAPDKKDRHYRRPYGCAVIRLSSLNLEAKLGVEQSPPPATMYVPTKEEDFPTLHTTIINDPKGLQEAPKAKGIVVGLTMYAGDKVTARVTNDDKKLNLAEVSGTDKFDFSEHMSAQEERNDFYVHLDSANLSQGRKTSAMNVECSIRVCDNTGRTIANCIRKASGPAVDAISEFKSVVFYHKNDPVWNETILLRLEPDLFERCHILITVWHVSSNKKPSCQCFAFHKLTTPSGAVVPDGEVMLETYETNEKVEKENGNNAYYLLKERAEPKLILRPKESIKIRTKLTSTKKTQNDVLYSLFKWRKLDQSVLRSMCVKFCNIKQGGLEELSRFIRETFDSFFAILGSSSHEESHAAVFDAFVHSLTLLTDNKIRRYRPIVDSYIMTLMNSPSAHSVLLSHALRKFEEAGENPDAKMMNMCKTMDYMMKFVVASRKIDLAQSRPTVDDAKFKETLRMTFDGMAKMVGAEEQKTARYLVPSKTFIVRGFPLYMEDLAEVYTADELGKVAVRMIESIPSAEKQNVNKLNLIRLIMNGDLGKHKDAQSSLFPVVLRSLKTHLNHIDSGNLSEPYLCIAILQRVLGIVQNTDDAESKETDKEADMWQFREILPELVKVVYVVQRNARGEGAELKPPSETVMGFVKIDLSMDSMTCVWAILHGLSTEQVNTFILSLTERAMARFVAQLLKLCTLALQLKTYKDTWIVMLMLQMSTTIKMLSSVMPALKGPLGPKQEDSYAPATWRSWFALNLEMQKSEHLDLESFGASKKQFVMDRYGDMRAGLLEQVEDMWNSLGDAKVDYIGDLVAPLFDTIQNSQLARARQMALDMYFDMIVCEFKVTKDFSSVERHTIDSLYNIANASQAAGDKFTEFIFNTMQDRFEKNDSIKKEGEDFLNHIRRMYELMSSLLKFPNTAVYEDERTSVALRLMTYLEESGHTRKEMSARYVDYLVNLHRGLGNMVEAGMAQLYQIKLLDWSDTPMDASGDLEAQRECERKEALVRKAISFYNEGSDWERCIEMCEVLRQYHQNVSFDYSQLGEILKEEADFFMKIQKSERYYSSYFRVCFYGYGFDEEIRGKEFIYRGVVLEPVMDFTNRIKKKFDKAQILMSSDTPSEQAISDHPHRQIISITTLTKEPTLRSLSDVKEVNYEEEKDDMHGHESSKKARVAPKNIQDYKDNSDLIVFSYAKAEQKAKEKKPTNEFKNLWVIKNYLQAEVSFPTNRRRVMVANRKTVLLSPIENAVSAIKEKNAELRTKIETVRNAKGPTGDLTGPVDVGPLSMNLNGMIDAAVNGGTGKYIEAFLCKEFKEANTDPKSMFFIKELKRSLKDQILVLADGLDVFSLRCEDSLKGLLDHLQKFYRQMTSSMKQTLQ